MPKAFTACVKTQHSAAPLSEKYGSKGVNVLANENVRGVESADVVILGVEPNIYGEVLGESSMRDALSGKILVSIVGGVNTEMLSDAIYKGKPLIEDGKGERTQCQIIRVLPNTAAAVRECISLIIEEKKDQYPPDVLNPVCSLFTRVGSVKLWCGDLGPVGASLSSSSVAFWAEVLEGAVDGAVRLDMGQADALELAAAAMSGAAALMRSGESPSEVRRKVATPGGSTAVGLKTLEDGKARGIMEQALINTVEKANGLGQKTSSG